MAVALLVIGALAGAGWFVTHDGRAPAAKVLEPSSTLPTGTAPSTTTTVEAPATPRVHFSDGPVTFDLTRTVVPVPGDATALGSGATDRNWMLDESDGSTTVEVVRRASRFSLAQINAAENAIATTMSAGNPLTVDRTVKVPYGVGRYIEFERAGVHARATMIALGNVLVMVTGQSFPGDPAPASYRLAVASLKINKIHVG